MAEGTRRTQGIRPEERLTVDRIVEAALRAVDAAGPDAVSFSALARTLGVTKPAITWHIRDRQLLFDMVAARWLNSIRPPRRQGSLASWVRSFAHRYRAAALEHPNLARLAPAGIASGRATAIPGALVTAFAEADAACHELAAAYNSVLAAVVGFVELELAHAAHHPSAASPSPVRPVTERFEEMEGRAFGVGSRGPLIDLDESFAFLVARLTDHLRPTEADERCTAAELASEPSSAIAAPVCNLPAGKE